LQLEHRALQRELQLTQQHIQQARDHQNSDKESQPIAKEIVFSLLNQLAELPLTQGELSALSLSEQYLTLTGHSVNQEEFSRLNRFLSDQALFREVKLTEFKPQQQEMRFQFDLTLQAQP
jgi:comB, putative